MTTMQQQLHPYVLIALKFILELGAQPGAASCNPRARLANSQVRQGNLLLTQQTNPNNQITIPSCSRLFFGENPFVDCVGTLGPQFSR